MYGSVKGAPAEQAKAKKHAEAANLRPIKAKNASKQKRSAYRATTSQKKAQPANTRAISK